MNSLQNVLMKMESLSQTMVCGIPWNHPTILWKVSAVTLALNFLGRDMKWAYLVSRSIVTKMVSIPSDLGNTSMKSIDISIQGQVKINSSIKYHGGQVASYFSLWQTKHSFMNFFTFAFIPFHQNCVLTRWASCSPLHIQLSHYCGSAKGCHGSSVILCAVSPYLFYIKG